MTIDPLKLTIDQFELVTFFNKSAGQQIVLVYALAAGDVYEYRGDHWLRLLPLDRAHIREAPLPQKDDGRV